MDEKTNIRNQIIRSDASVVFGLLATAEEGLTASEAAKRLETYGPNLIPEKKKAGPLAIFLRQFMNFMIFVLVIAAVISGYLGDFADTLIILGIVLVNAIIGFYQEYNAEKALQALRNLSALNASVVRDGMVSVIPASELVPGDLVVLESGNTVPSDIRLTETHSLKIDESTLTGESVTIDKASSPIEKEDVPLGDMINLAFKGTNVTYGRGKGVVYGTGINTELGKIAALLQTEETMTPLQLRMSDFSRKLSYIILIICLIIFIAGWIRGEDPFKMLLLAISLAVAAIPEALPALITVALAQGSSRMVRKNALVRKLPAVETLGSVDFICSDKTGTLTMNKMSVTDVYAGQTGDMDSTSLLELAMCLNNDVVSQHGEYMGDPTEIALARYVDEKYGPGTYEARKKEHPRVAELPFDSGRKCMTTIHRWHSGYMAFSKGAAESLADRMVYQDQNHWQEHVSRWTEDGKRVLLFTYRYFEQCPDVADQEAIEQQLSFVGLAGMTDPPREEVRAAIQECKAAGIRPVMITGDHQATAVAIAKKIGIWQETSQTLTGTELKNIPEHELSARVEDISVYARVSPEQKLNIIAALKAKSHFIAMTGDGVNDAPALKAANIGIAMGINGTDVSKEASDMVLLDDNFATIVKAVKEGRRIFDNIRKFIKYIMTCNSAEIMVIVFAPLIGLPLPLLPIHILWINLVTDGLPGLALAGERAENDIMQRPPRKANESLFSEGIGYHIIWVGLLMAVITLATQAWCIKQNYSHWQTMVFTVLAFSQLGHVLAIRSERTFLYKQGPFTNKLLIVAVMLTLALQMVVIYLPYANKVMNTQPLSVPELIFCLGVASIVFHAVELEKYIKSRRKNNNETKDL